MMTQRERTERETATIRDRSIQLHLSDADCYRISEAALSAGMSVAELLQYFIGDLTNGTCSNGSDERMLAGQWYERCGFRRFREETFTIYLFETGLLDDALDALGRIDDLQMELRDVPSEEMRRDILDDIRTNKNWFRRIYDEYTCMCCGYRVEDPEKAMEGLRTYRVQITGLLKGQ